MTSHTQKKQKGKEEDRSGKIAAAITGVIVGAGAIAAGAMVLKDKKNRKKIEKALTNARDRAVDYFEDIQKQKQNERDKTEEKVTENKEKIEKTAVDSIKNTVS